MLYRIVVGDATQVRGIVELELEAYTVDADGSLAIFDSGEKERQEIGRWAPGRWHSIVAVEQWNKARKAGVGDENPRGRLAPRPTQTA